MEDKTTTVVMAVAFSLIILAALGYYIYGEMNQYQFKHAYGESITTMCLTPGGGGADLRNAPPDPKPWRAVVIDTDHKHAWHAQLPAEARAEDRQTTDVVVCMAAEGKQVIEECPYVSTDISQQTFTIARVQLYRDLVVLNPDTGLRIADLRVWGKAPENCPDFYQQRGNEIKGDDPQFRDFYYTLLNLTWR